MGTLADGSKFDFGKDGKGLGKLNYEDPVTGKLIALSNVISAGEGMAGKSQQAMAELYTNAALSNTGGDLAKGIENIRHFAQQRGFTLENVQSQLDKMLDEKQIKPEEHAVFSNDARELFGSPPGQRRPWQPGDPVSQQSMDKLRQRQKKKGLLGAA
jgi:hypothetical protein